MKIGELARRASTTPETIRFYERSGLLPPPRRTAANYRDFGAAHIERLQFIRRCRTLGIGLGEVRALLSYRDEPGGCCEGVDEILDAQIARVSARIAELRLLQRQLATLRASCPGDLPISDCGILQNLASP